MRILTLLCAAIAAAAAIIPQAAAVEFPAGVAQPAFTFGLTGTTIDAAGDRIESWSDGTFEAQLQADTMLGAPTFNARTNATDFGIEDAPSLFKLVTAATPDAPAINFAAPFTFFVVLSVPASSACMQEGTTLSPARPCAIFSAGDLASVGDFALTIMEGKLSATLNTSATAGTALATATATSALTADTLTVVRVHYDSVNAQLELKYGDTPFSAATAFDASVVANTTSPTWIGGPQPSVSVVSPAPVRFFEGSLMEIAVWLRLLDSTDDAAIFQYLDQKWSWAQTPLDHTAIYPGPLHAPDWILNASLSSGVTLNAEGLVSSWEDTAGAYRTEVGQAAPAVVFNAVADATAGAPSFDPRLPAVVFGSGGLTATVSPSSVVHWNRASLFFVLRVPSTSACLQPPTDVSSEGCLIWSSTATGLSAVGDIALTINRNQHFSVGIMEGSAAALIPIYAALDAPIEPDVAIVLHVLIDETAGLVLLTDGVNQARSEISVPIDITTAAESHMVFGMASNALSSSTLSPFDGGMLMELQAWIPSVESAAAVLTRQERLDTIETLKAKWAHTDFVPALPPAALDQSSSGAAAEESSTGDAPVDSSSGAAMPTSPSSSGPGGPSTIPASARAVLRFLNKFPGIDCSLPADRAKIKTELSTALGIAQTFLAINASTAPPDNRIAIDLFSTGSSGAPSAVTQSVLRTLLRRLLAIGGDPTDPALQIAQLEIWRNSDDAPWKTDAASYPSLSLLDPSEPIAAASTAEAPITNQRGEKQHHGDDDTPAIITSIVLITFVILLLISCLAGRYIWKKNAEAAAARSTANHRGGGAFGPEDPERELGERESHATDASGSRGLRRAAADGALRSPSYLHHPSPAHENSLREPSGIGGNDSRLREVSLREARKAGSGAGGSPLARGSNDDDDGADAEEAAVWASLSPESQAAHGRDPGLRLHSIELQPKEANGRKTKASAGGGSAAERAAAARAAARAASGAKPAAAPHVIASEYPVGADEEEEEEEAFAARGAEHTNSNNNQRTKTFPVRLHE